MKIFWGLILVTGVAVFSVWPMVMRMDRVADYGKDGMFLATVQMNWHQKISDYIRHKTDPKMSFFDGYFYYAEKNSLAFSDMLFVTSLLTYWPAKLSNNPSMGAGIGLVMGQVLTMIISYAIFVKMSKSITGAVIGSIAFGLSQIHFMYQVHLHTWTMQYWLLGYWLFGQRRYALSGVFLGLQMWESPLGVYFALIMIAVKLISYRLSISQLAKNLNSLVIFFIVIGVVAYLPAKAYWDVSRFYGYVRTIRDAAYHGLSINDLDGFVSPGLFVLFILGIYGVIRFQTPNFKYVLLVIITSYILALGPVLKWDGKTVKIGGIIPVPLPYAAAYYTIPGWQAFRVPSRWLVVTGWGMAAVIAMAIGKSQKKYLGIIGYLVMAILGGTRLTKYVDLPREIPAEYKTTEEVLVFKPMGGEPEEIERMYFSILAGKKTMNGFSGFIPPNRVKWLNEK